MAVLFCGLHAPITVQAGIIEVFGDVNSMASNTAPRNQLLDNLLGSGTNVVVSDKLPSDYPDGSTFNNHFNSTFGVTSTLSSASIDSSVLTGVDLLFVNIGCCGTGPAGNPYSAAEVSAMATFLQSGGNVGLLSEPCCYNAAQGTWLNTMLTALGSTIQFTGWVGDAGTATMSTSPLTTGVVGYAPGTFSTLTGGQSLATLNGHTMIASDNIAGVHEPATLALLGLSLLGLAFNRRRRLR
ncbi:MAG: hypothetical protein ACI8Z1_001709 [Candidatus Azotimanducaceae bacterium]|jgi:hypothetical protein